MLKWQQDTCECGLDLTTANPVDEFFNKDEAGKVIAFGVCPKCGRTLPMIKVEEPKPEVPKRKRASEAPPVS